MSKRLSIVTRRSYPFEIGDNTVKLLSRSLRFQPASYRWALIWQRPTAVVIRQQDGEQQTLPIEDITRRTQVMILTIGLLVSLLIWLGLRKR